MVKIVLVEYFKLCIEKLFTHHGIKQWLSVTCQIWWRSRDGKSSEIEHLNFRSSIASQSGKLMQANSSPSIIKVNKTAFSLKVSTETNVKGNKEL